MLIIEKWLENKILRTKSKDIEISEIIAWKYNSFVSEMKKEINSPERGKITLWIASPQVWKNINLIVIREILETTSKGEIIKDKIYEMYNPIIISLSKDTNLDYEGCLSIPWIEDKVERANIVVVEYINWIWEKVKKEYKGLNARVVQHEIDHLNWILFTDYLKQKYLF